MKSPFIIYADFQWILEPENNRKQNLNVSYTNKYQKHISCSYGHNLQFWTNLLPQNRKSLFPWKSHSSPKSSNVFWKVLGFRKKNLARFNIDFGWWGREFANWKTESFLEFTGSSNFVSTSFYQGCGEILKI